MSVLALGVSATASALAMSNLGEALMRANIDRERENNDKVPPYMDLDKSHYSRNKRSCFKK